MRMRKAMILVALVLVSGIMAWAGEKAERIPFEARVDVLADTVGSTLKFIAGSDNFKGENPLWTGDLKPRFLYTHGPVGEDYRDYSFSFVANTDGAVVLAFMGNWAKDTKDMPFIEFSSVTLEGATVRDLGFDTVFAAHHEKRYRRAILVKAGQPVKVSFKAKLGHQDVPVNK